MIEEIIDSFEYIIILKEKKYKNLGRYLPKFLQDCKKNNIKED